MRIKVISAVAVSSFFMAGCTGYGGVKPNNPSMTGEFYGTYLFVNECHTKLEEKAGTLGVGAELAAALASGVVKTGIDWIGAALQKAAEDDIDKTTVGSNLLSVSQMSDESKNVCVQIVRGEFQYAKDDKLNYSNSYAVNSESRTVAPLQIVEGTEELYIEMLPIIHENYISFAPLEVRYTGYTPSDKKSKKPRDLAVFVGYAQPATDISSGDFTGRLIDFGTLSPIGSEQAKIKYVTEDKKISLVNSTQWVSLPDANEASPITFAANVIETRKASQFAKFLAAAFESSREDIKTKADSALAELDIFKKSKELEKEKIEVETERLEAEKTYFDSLASVLTAEEELSTLCGGSGATESQIFAAQQKLYFAKKTANISAMSAGRPRHYEDSDITLPSRQCPESTGPE